MDLIQLISSYIVMECDKFAGKERVVTLKPPVETGGF